jgi:hypothetical protein
MYRCQSDRIKVQVHGLPHANGLRCRHCDPWLAVALRKLFITGCFVSVGAIACGEGIASLEQLQALVAIGCDWAQGSFFGKPQPIDAFKTGLRPVKTETDPVQGTGDTYEWPDDNAV